MQDKLIFACFMPKKVATQKLERNNIKGTLNFIRVLFCNPNKFFSIIENKINPDYYIVIVIINVITFY